ncbi:terminase [Empedobacter brevis]|nr:terminase [Empedobacter brevis]
MEKKRVGAPSLYKTEYNEQARKLCLLGATDAELGDFFNVTETTINNWKIDFPEFFESIKKGKEYADANVANKLYNRALGYEHEEDKIFNDQGVPLIVPTIKHYPPDTAAAIFWLKNRQPAKWREKQEVEATLKIEQPLFGDD